VHDAFRQRRGSFRLAAGLCLLAGVLSAFAPAHAEDAETTSAPLTFDEEVRMWWDGSSVVPDIMVDDWPVARLGPPHDYSALPRTSLRADLADLGFSFFGIYRAFFFGNVSGGLSQGFAYNSILFFQFSFDLEKLAGWKDGAIVWSFADNNGSNLSQTIGNNYQVSWAYGPNTFLFNELYFRQTFFDEALSIKVGQLSLFNSFAASELYTYYSNLAFLAPISLYYNTGGTAMPVASWGARAKFTQPQWYAQAGVYQVSDRLGAIADHGWNYAIEPGDGALVFAESGWTPTFGKTSGAPGYAGNYKFGAYYSGWNYENYLGGANGSNAYGFYWLADQMVFQEKERPSDGLYLWSAFTVSPQEDIAQLPYFVSGGAQYQGLIPGRNDDRAVFGVAYGSYSADLRNAQRSQGQSPEFYEMVFEWAYQIAITDCAWIQPDVQYIVNPGATGGIPNAWVIGAVLNVNF
jgi:porin